MRRVFLLLASVTVFGLPLGVVEVHAAPLASPSASDPYGGMIAEAAERFAIPQGWLRAVMHVESHRDQRAVSPKGAMGLMQLMPATWTALRDRYSLGRDPFDPHDNILAGAAFLRAMHDRYGSPGFLAAYNAGPGRYEDYRDRGRPLPPETLAYVATILPCVGSDGINGPILLSASYRLTWTHAPLFIGRSEDTEMVGRGPSDQRTAYATTIFAVHDAAARAAEFGRLFVGVSASGPKP